MKYVSVAIDGPSGAGKSTVARAAAAQLGYVYVDTGAMYRTIGLAVCRRGISGEDTEGIRSVLPDIRVGITYENGAQHVLLNGEDVSSEIRTPEIAYYASRVSAVPEVREFLLNTQRDMAKNGNILMDGRDIGTVILPDAPVKIFLTASAESRAERRYKELAEKGGQVVGVNSFTLDGNKDEIADAKDVLSKKGVTYKNVWFKSDSEAGKFTSNLFSFPTTYVIDQNGNIVGEPIVGAISSAEQRAALDKLIDQAIANSEQ